MKKKIITDISNVNDIYFKAFLEKSIYRLKEINLFLDIFLNLSLEKFVSINKVPIKNIFIESENFITKLDLIQKSLANAVIALKEEMSDDSLSNVHEKKYILSFDSNGCLDFVNDMFLEKFNLDRDSILKTHYKLPISEKDKERVNNLLRKLENKEVNHVETRLRVNIDNGEEWQHWYVTAFDGENGKYSRKSIGYTIMSENIRNERI